MRWSLYFSLVHHKNILFHLADKDQWLCEARCGHSFPTSRGSPAPQSLHALRYKCLRTPVRSMISVMFFLIHTGISGYFPLLQVEKGTSSVIEKYSVPLKIHVIEHITFFKFSNYCPIQECSLLSHMILLYSLNWRVTLKKIVTSLYACYFISVSTYLHVNLLKHM